MRTDEAVETSLSGNKSFQVNVFHVVIDQINASIKIRFSDQNRVCQDLSCFDPFRFPELRTIGIPEHALEKICSLIPDIDKGKLLEELESFIEQWPSVNMSLNYLYQKDSDDIQNEDVFDMQSSSDSEDEETIVCSGNKYCQS